MQAKAPNQGAFLLLGGLLDRTQLTGNTPAPQYGLCDDGHVRTGPQHRRGDLLPWGFKSEVCPRLLNDGYETAYFRATLSFNS